MAASHGSCPNWSTGEDVSPSSTCLPNMAIEFPRPMASAIGIITYLPYLDPPKLKSQPSNCEEDENTCQVWYRLSLNRAGKDFRKADCGGHHVPVRVREGC